MRPCCHITSHITKTTFHLPDSSLIAAKTLAARRRTTFKATVGHALRRGIAPQEKLAPDSPSETGPSGMLCLNKRPRRIPDSSFEKLIDHQYNEEDSRLLSIAMGKR